MTHTRNYDRRNYSENRFRRLITELNGWLSDIARKRVNGTVTADDVHEYLNDEGFTHGEVNARLALINSVLRGPQFRATNRQVPSMRPAAKRRVITEWARS